MRCLLPLFDSLAIGRVTVVAAFVFLLLDLGLRSASTALFAAVREASACFVSNVAFATAFLFRESLREVRVESEVGLRFPGCLGGNATSTGLGEIAFPVVSTGFDVLLLSMI